MTGTGQCIMEEDGAFPMEGAGAVVASALAWGSLPSSSSLGPASSTVGSATVSLVMRPPSVSVVAFCCASVVVVVATAVVVVVGGGGGDEWDWDWLLLLLLAVAVAVVS